MKQPNPSILDNQHSGADHDIYAFPLSFAQQRLWVIQQMEDVGSAFNIYGAFYVGGTFEISVFKSAIQFLVNRHETFRTTFELIQDKAVQVVHPNTIVEIEVEDLALVPLSEDRINAICLEESRFVFDIEKGPLFRIKVIRCSAEKHVLSFCFHHIISDGWSVGVFARELQIAYDAIMQDLPVPLPELPFQYADYTIWQREQFEAGAMQDQLDFWKEFLHGAPESVNFLLDNPRGPVQTFSGDSVSFFIPEEQHRRLKQIADQAGATLYMTMLAVFSVLLSRYTLQDDMLIGSVVANRNRNEWESLIGFLVNIVVFRLKPDADDSFFDFLKEVKSDAMKVYDNQDVPFEKLLDELGVRRDASRNPLFQTMFTMQVGATEGSAFGGLLLTPITVQNNTTKYDLTAGITATADGLHGTFQFNTDLFHRATIERMAVHFCRLIDAVIKDPQKVISKYSFITQEERKEVLKWNSTLQTYPGITVVEMIRQRALETPHSPAIFHNQYRLNYAELDQQSNRLSQFLLKNVTKGKIIAVCMERSPEMIVCFLAVLKAGCAYLAIDVAHPTEHREFILGDSGATVLLTNHDHSIQSDVLPVICLQDINLESYPEYAPVIYIQPTDPAYVIYTSGSTGKPKGVAIHHKALQNLVHWHNTSFGVTTADHCTQVAGISFDASVWEIWPTLFAGAALHILNRELLLDVQALQREVIEQNITVCFWPTPLAELMFALDWPAKMHLRYVLIGGDKMRRRPTALLPFTVIDNYGLTEACVVSSSGILNTDLSVAATIGKPIANTVMLVLDQQMQLVPAGVQGEIYITGEGLAINGYINRAELNAERFMPNPFKEIPYSQLYKTGDIGTYTPEGDIRYFGRIDRQVKIRGHRIEIPEVEAGILLVPGVTTCAVIVKTRNDGANQLVAFVVMEPTPNELRAELQKILPGNMVPSLIVKLPVLPITNNGKIDYKYLQEHEETESDAEPVKHEPASAYESDLIDIWQQVLGVTDVGLDDNFFELGGDSINTIQVASMARRMNMVLSSKHIFLHQTIRQLSAEISSSEVIISSDNDDSASFALHPIQQWFFEQQAPNNNHFNHSMVVDTQPGSNAELLQQSFYQLAEHHDILRLRFYNNGNTITQAYDNDKWRDNFVTHRLAGSEQDYAIIQTLAVEAQTSLDIFDDKLYRIIFFDRGPYQLGKLVFVFHHLIIDSFSWRVLLSDFYSLYQQQNTIGSFKPLIQTHSYKKYINYLNDIVKSPEYSKNINYWFDQWDSDAGSLPYDLADQSNTFGETKTVTAILGKDTTDELVKNMQRIYRTGVNTILIAALIKTIADWKQQNSVGITLESLGRHEQEFDIDLSRTVGWFTAMYPLYFDLPDSDWSALIKLVKEKLMQVPGNGVYFGMGRYISHSQQLKSLPSPQISFNYHGNSSDRAGHKEWNVSGDNYGQQICGSFPRQHLLDVTCAIENEQLVVNWIYNPAIHNRKTVDMLAAAFNTNVTDIVSTHADVKQIYYTPSDFPSAAISQADLDEILIGRRYDFANIYPLAPMHSGMLFHSVYHGKQSNAYFVQMSLLLEGSLNATALLNSWNATLNNHDALKTSFIWQNIANPLQVVFNDVVIPWQYSDISHLTDEELVSESILKLQQEHEDEGFAFDQAPLMRLHLVKKSDRVHELIWSYHHLVMDGWSMPIVLKEVFSRYRNAVRGSNETFIKPAPFFNYIKWLNQQDTNTAVEFWRSELGDIDEPTFFKADMHVTDDQSFIYGEEKVLIKEQSHSAINKLLKKNKVTLNAFFQALWSIIICSYTDKDEAIFGATVSGRPPAIAGIEGMVGVFINTIPIRIRVQEDADFFNWVHEVQLKQSAREEYSYLPLAEIQKLSGLTGNTALFDTILIIENYPGLTSDEDSDTGLQVSINRGYERIEIPLCVIVTSNENLNIKISYDAGRYSPGFINGLLSHFESSIEAILKIETPLINEISLLPASAIDQLLYGLNNIPWQLPEDTVIDLFEAQAFNNPQRVAVSDELCTTLTYVELNASIRQVAAYIVKNAANNRPIAVLMERSVAMMVTLLAVMKAGHAYIPLDPSFPAERIRVMLADGQPGMVITNIESSGDSLIADIQLVYYDDIFKLPCEDQVRFLRIKPTDSAYIIYTSGSTGRPKGVEISHSSLTNFLLSFKQSLNFTAEHRLLALTTISFDIAALELYLPLICGAQVLLASSETAREPYRLVDTINSFQPDFIQATPATWSMLTEAGWYGASFLSLIIGGEALPVKIAAALVNNCREIINVYGPTETTIWSSYHTMQRDVLYAGSFITIGKPIANTTFYILNKKRRLVPFGQTGELYIGGKGLAKGYYNNPIETGKRFVNHTFENGTAERLYQTGDMVRYLPSGDLEYISRTDNQIKIRGFRIELGDIEAAIMQYPGVHQAVCIAQKDESNGFSSIAGFVVKHQEVALKIDALKVYLQQALPYYMIPAALHIVDKFPHTPNNKIDRNELLKLDMGFKTGAEANAKITSRTLTEMEVLNIWEEVFKSSNISVKDNFFDIGGHSILAVKLMSRVQSQFGRDCSIAMLMQNPTIEELASAIELNNGNDCGLLIPLKKGGDKAPILLIPGEGGSIVYFNRLAKYLATGHPVYGLQFPGLDGVSEVATSIEELANLFTDIISRNFGNKPIILAGHSLGGKVAFELACALSLEKTLSKLIILDTIAPVHHTVESENQVSDAAWLCKTIQRMGELSNVPLSITEKQLTVLLPEQQMEEVKRLLADANLIPKHFDTGRVQSFLSVLKSSQQMVYKPSVYPNFNIHLFKAANNETYIAQVPLSENILSSFRKEDYCWRSLTSGNVTVKLISGDHGSILNEPNVQLLAKEFNRLINT
ncbi:non-ribosomal peptide synthetase [Daejeonella sp.]|uniref:non-ribosomal peptide synthetase n=1 Tax=Daejeonella sp. TaxID=2805397 RepID=UPI00272FDBAD|nr:non-ribosomal peptide synthetase [Daejeonella sp.]MDP2414101.1 amino acid adenylation domain-containing protein [Daejeonella sp.]